MIATLIPSGTAALSLVDYLILKSRTNRAAVDTDSCAAHIISDRASQVRYCCGDLLWPTETAHVVWSHGKRKVVFDFLQRLAPTMSLAQMDERWPSCLGKDRAGSYDV